MTMFDTLQFKVGQDTWFRCQFYGDAAPTTAEVDRLIEMLTCMREAFPTRVESSVTENPELLAQQDRSRR